MRITAALIVLVACGSGGESDAIVACDPATGFDGQCEEPCAVPIAQPAGVTCVGLNDTGVQSETGEVVHDVGCFDDTSFRADDGRVGCCAQGDGTGPARFFECE